MTAFQSEIPFYVLKATSVLSLIPVLCDGFEFLFPLSLTFLILKFVNPIIPLNPDPCSWNQNNPEILFWDPDSKIHWQSKIFVCDLDPGILRSQFEFCPKYLNPDVQIFDFPRSIIMICVGKCWGFPCI